MQFMASTPNFRGSVDSPDPAFLSLCSVLAEGPLLFRPPVGRPQRPGRFVPCEIEHSKYKTLHIFISYNEVLQFNVVKIRILQFSCSLHGPPYSDRAFSALPSVLYS